MNNEHFPEKNKKLDDKLKKKRKNSDGIKKSIFRIKSEKSKQEKNTNKFCFLIV